MSKIYCGIKDVPKGSKRGNMRECADKHQVRYFGLKKIDSRSLQKIEDSNTLREKYLSYLKIIAPLKGKLGRINRELKNPISKEKKQKMRETKKNLIKEININAPLYKEFKDKYEKAVIRESMFSVGDKVHIKNSKGKIGKTIYIVNDILDVNKYELINESTGKELKRIYRSKVLKLVD